MLQMLQLGVAVPHSASHCTLTSNNQTGEVPPLDEAQSNLGLGHQLQNGPGSPQVSLRTQNSQLCFAGWLAVLRMCWSDSHPH